jgi:hypothetical protein
VFGHVPASLHVFTQRPLSVPIVTDHKILVWDAPTRLFHSLIVPLVVAAYAKWRPARAGGQAFPGQGLQSFGGGLSVKRSVIQSTAATAQSGTSIGS